MTKEIKRDPAKQTPDKAATLVERSADINRDPRQMGLMHGLRGEDRIAAALEIDELSHLGQGQGLPPSATLQDAYDKREADIRSGIEGASRIPNHSIFAGLDDQPTNENKALERSPLHREWYDGHHFHVVREVGAFNTFGGSVRTYADFFCVGDNDEEFNEAFTAYVDDCIATGKSDAFDDGANETTYQNGIRAFAEWRNKYGASFDLESVGAVTHIKARSGIGFWKTFGIAFLGGFAAWLAIVTIWALMSFLPVMTQ